MNMITRDVEFRLAAKGSENNDGRTLEGYAAVFDQDTDINSWEGRFSERIAKGAFKKTLRERKPIMQFNHGRDARTGQVPIGVFEDLREDDHGLYVEGRMLPNDLVEPIRQAIESGAITGMSFTFRVVRDEWRDNKGKQVKGDEIYRLLYEPGERGPLQRTIREVQLFEAGPVVNPAYAGTSVGVRSADQLTEEERQAVAAEYLKTMAEINESESEHRSGWTADEYHCNDCWKAAGARTSGQSANPEQWTVRHWLEAESTWRWLEAETAYRTSCEAWLAAENTHLDTDAAQSGTSRDQENPDRNAVQKDTLQREPKEKESGATAPKPVRTRAMTLNEMKEQLVIAEARVDELNEEFRDAEFPETEQREFEGLEAEIPKLKKRIKTVEDRMAAVNAAAGSAGRVEGAPAFHKKEDAADLHDIVAIRNSASSYEDAKAKMLDAAKKIAERAKFATSERSEAKDYAIHLLDKDHTGDLAERFINNGSELYERAWSKYAAGHNIGGLTFDEQRALQLGSDADGGFAVPVELDPTVIWTSAGVVNPVRQLATVKTITGKEYQGVTSAGTTVSRSAEGAEFAENTFTLAQPTIRTERVTGYTTFTYEAEAWNSIREEIVFALRDAKDREEAESFTNGSGTSPAASGIISTHIAPNLVTAGGTAAFADTDLYALKEALDPRYRANAVFMMDEAILHLIRRWATNDGPNLIQHIDGPNPDRLLGFPIYENFNMAGVLTTGTKIVQFGDLSNYYIVDRVGMSVEVNPMVLGSNRRPTGQRGIAAYWMNNAKWWVPAGAKTLKTG